MRGWNGWILGTLVVLGGCQGGAAGGGGGGAPMGSEGREVRNALGEAQIEAARAEARLASQDTASARIAILEVRRRLAEARRHAPTGLQGRLDELDETATLLDRQVTSGSREASGTAERLNTQVHGVFVLTIVPSSGGGAGPVPAPSPPPASLSSPSR